MPKLLNSKDIPFPFMRVPFSVEYNPDLVAEATGLRCADLSLTEQDEASDADINVLMKRFGVTGQLPEPGSIPLITNGEFVEAMTCQQAMDVIRRSTESFMELPAEVREEFGHDAARFVNYCSDAMSVPSKMARLRDLGVAVPPEAPPPEVPPQRVTIVQDDRVAPAPAKE